ncbi:IscS subfamily cysteine desulfurase [Halobacillus sp. H74]|uniref:IscS subfamily cysteine desulfurase n=1 Tax=Halobacillus sp. H74 TaxID=3457436 RepID=UPI003FCDA7C1
MYFDYAATCPIDDEALEAYVQASKEYYANSHSLHDEGTKAEKLLEHCRTELATALGVEMKGVYFTSGGTESNEIALYALVKAGEGRHLVISEAEHSSVYNVASKLQSEGYDVSWVPVSSKGEVDMARLQEEIRKDTVLVSVQHVNSDIGTIQPLREISQLCRKENVLFHSDCVQSFGKLDIKEVSPFVDSLSISSHKVYGPKGVGAVYIRPDLTFAPRIPGGSHEGGVRAGTVNVPGIAAFIVAAGKMVQRLQENQQRVLLLKENFFRRIELSRNGWSLVGASKVNTIPIIGLCVHDFEGQWLMLEGNRKGYRFSTGSACQSRSEGTSATLHAMGITKEQARTFIRISFSHDQQEADILKFSGWLSNMIAERST